MTVLEAGIVNEIRNSREKQNSFSDMVLQKTSAAASPTDLQQPGSINRKIVPTLEEEEEEELDTMIEDELETLGV